ncbi:HIRAN domain-containing protein [Pseudomonas lurida]|uniref:HIRAN domain-containing protein n=1 Tax=Pseudomonas lurida TaxID=244566 RepID=UPI0034D985A0
MNEIEHIFEPSRLLLVWHHANADAPKNRRVVGELLRHGDDASFKYLKGTDDFRLALEEGFHEFPAFADAKGEPDKLGALDVFVRRLPPRRREDFQEYLKQYNLPIDFAGSSFALLAYTGARLPSDTFELCPDLSDAKAPLDLIVEVAGLTHHMGDSVFSESDRVFFEKDPTNLHDTSAVKVIHNNKHVGYINKALAPSFTNLIDSGDLTGSIIKFTNTKGKPRLLVLVKYT